MLRIRTLRVLSALDAGSLLADPLLRMMIMLPMVVALAVRVALPLVLPQVGLFLELDLDWLLLPMSGYVAIGIAPLLAGGVVGFLLLDQRDDRTLLALRVTPVPLGLYLAYRLTAPMLTAFVITLAAMLAVGGAGLSPATSVIAALGAAPLAPVAALALAALARNKVQGLALVKASSVVLAAPLVSLFLPSAWQFVFYPLPTYQLARAIWALQAGAPVWGWLAGTWLTCWLLIGLLYRRLRRVLQAA